MKAFFVNDNGFVERDEWSPHCWVNVECPDQEDVRFMLDDLHVPESFLESVSDADERPRIEHEGEWRLTILRIPLRLEGDEMPYGTVPIGIITNNEVLLTVCYRFTEMVNDFIDHTRCKGIAVDTEPDFILRILYSSAYWYLRYLKDINNHVTVDEKRLEKSIKNEDLLYKLFGVNAELLIDHAWGWEPVTMADIKAYTPESKSIGSGQVLQCPYGYDKARLVVREMADQLALDLVDKSLVTDQLVLTVGYDIENLKGRGYKGEVIRDRYGRAVPKHAHGTSNLEEYTASTRRIITAALELFDRIIDRSLLVRRLYLTATRVSDEKSAPDKKAFEQMDFFTDYHAVEEKRAKETAELEREKKVQRTVLDIKKRFGKNAILKGMNLEEGATAKERNRTIGGHRSGEV